MFAAILHKQIALAYRKYVGNDGMKYDMGVVVSLTVIYVIIITRGNCPFGSLIDMNVRICLEYRLKIIEANNCRRRVVTMYYSYDVLISKEVGFLTIIGLVRIITQAECTLPSSNTMDREVRTVP